MIDFEENRYLVHYGVKGQKRGHRRWQNEDGSLTEEGKIHYGVGDGEQRRRKTEDDSRREQKKEMTPEEREARKKKVKKILAITAGVTLAAAAGYMAYRVGDQWTKNIQDEYKNQAMQRSRDAHTYERNANYMASLSKKEAWALDSKIRKGGQNYDRRAMDVRWRSRAVKDALDYTKYAKEFGQKAGSYSKLARTVTREEAVKNFIKNNGSIVIPYL